jgi:formate dehydrogenase major subunit
MDDTKDFGTPKINSEKLVTLTIDGIDISVPEGTSLMRAASEAGISVPKLCATDNLDPFGSCRLCLVERRFKKGRDGTLYLRSPFRLPYLCNKW